jgi:hypothetical protein
VSSLTLALGALTAAYFAFQAGGRKRFWRLFGLYSSSAVLGMGLILWLIWLQPSGFIDFSVRYLGLISRLFEKVLPSTVASDVSAFSSRFFMFGLVYLGMVCGILVAWKATRKTSAEQS